MRQVFTPSIFELQHASSPMYRLRLWSVKRARWLEVFYSYFEKLIVWLHPLWKAIGYHRLEKPFASSERLVKGMLFDCQMCGQCALSSTGMSCPMNCPKSLRNGPCGGVRSNGNCEVIADMPCVWVQAWEGSQKMANGSAIQHVQNAVDYRLKNQSSWLRIAQQHNQKAIED